MAQNLRGILKTTTPIIQIVRYRGKINIQRPRAPAYEKARILMATQPSFNKKPYDSGCVENKLENLLQVDNPYDKIIAKEAKNYFDHSKIIAFFHQNPIGSEDFFNARVAFHRQGMALKVFSRKILKLALTGTKFEAVLPLFTSHNSIAFCPAEAKVSQILKVSKKIPQMLLISGIAEGRFLSKNEFVTLSTMSNLQMCRAQFAATLDSVGSHLLYNFQANQKQLVSIFDSHANKAIEKN